MKKHYLLLSIVAGMAMMFLSCSKTGSNSVPPPVNNPPVKNTPSAPTTLTLRADTALYEGSATISVTTDGQVLRMDGNVVTGNSFTLTNLTSDRTVTFSVTNVNENGSSEPKTASIIVKVYSKKTTDLHNLSRYKASSVTVCPAANPTSCSNGMTPMMESYRGQFFANGTAACNCGPGGSWTTGVGVGWRWTDAGETAIDFSGDIWEVHSVSTNGFTRTQTKNGFITTQVFVKD